MNKLKNAISKANIAKHLCKHLLGKDHDTIHHMVVGGGVMVIGVLIAKQGGHMEAAVFHIGLDVIGYSLHGLGLTPYIEWALEQV
jgi:hypothetical protein